MAELAVTGSSTDALSKAEEAAHFQQLLRELALSDAPNVSSSAAASAAASAGVLGSQASGAAGAAASSSQQASSSDGAENFDQIAYIIKQILQTGKEDLFGEQLALFVAKKEAEIEKMCAFHYQEFVQSVDQLLKVRQGTVTLKDKILDLNDQMQDSGGKIVEKKREIIGNRHMLLNIELAVESLQSCLFVLDMANKVNANVENRKYYTALKMLEELQKTHLRPVMHYTFAKHMQEYIPIMQENIREVVLEEVQNWLVNIRENTRALGKQAMVHIAEKKYKSTHKAESLVRTLSASGSQLNLGPNLDLGAGEEDTDTFDVDHKIDFRPLYQCLHIHEVLNKRGELRAHYEEKRRMQASLLLSQKFSFESGNLEPFQTYLCDVVGFFIIEAAVLNSTQNFRSRGGVEGLWSTAMEKMNDVITNSLSDCRDPDLFLSIKISVVNFIDTMESYGFAVISLMDLMLSLLDRYGEQMKARCSETVEKIIEEDEYAPMVVNDQSEYDKVNAAFKLTPADGNPKSKPLKYVSKDWVDSVRFPKTLPFSRGFPQACNAIKRFITDFYRFAEGFEQQYNEMDDLLKKSLETLIAQDLNGALMRKVMVNNISQVVQILVNLEYFELACGDFETVLMERRISHKVGVIRLQAVQVLKESRVVAEKRMFDLLNLKMDDCLELADYDWNTTRSPSTYSPYLDDLVNFMSAIISSTLTNLPPHMRSLIYQGTFKHIAASIHNQILAPDVKRISPAAVDVLDKDIAFLEKFAQGAGEGNLGEAFAQLRQTITLLKSPNLEDILNSAIRDRRYPRIKLDKLAIVLEKMRGDTSMFAKSTAAEKAHRKSVEAVIKGIKTQPGISTWS
ncbi:hypothetical protein HDU88_004888 [Geranomyces variabilis]|nr:hypothetical protein HDU88_004888 [Geranomyces variabilis]